MKDKSSDAAFDWNVTGASICYLGIEVRLLIHYKSEAMSTSFDDLDVEVYAHYWQVINI